MGEGDDLLPLQEHAVRDVLLPKVQPLLVQDDGALGAHELPNAAHEDEHADGREKRPCRDVVEDGERDPSGGEDGPQTHPDARPLSALGVGQGEGLDLAEFSLALALFPLLAEKPKPVCLDGTQHSLLGVCLNEERRGVLFGLLGKIAGGNLDRHAPLPPLTGGMAGADGEECHLGIGHVDVGIPVGEGEPLAAEADERPLSHREALLPFTALGKVGEGVGEAVGEAGEEKAAPPEEDGPSRKGADERKEEDGVPPVELEDEGGDEQGDEAGERQSDRDIE